MTGPLVMTTTEVVPGDKMPRAVKGWGYLPEYFPAGQHTRAPGSSPGQLSDVYARHTGWFALDVDAYKDGKAEAWEQSATGRYLAGRRPYVERGTGGSRRYLVHQDPGQAAAWHPVAGRMTWGEIRSAGVGPSPGAVHPSGDTYEAVPGPDAVLYPADGAVVLTNVIRFGDGLRKALEADGARNRDDDGDMTAGDAGLPGDDGRCPLVLAWLQDTAGLAAATTATGTHANAAVNYLKRMDAEGHRIGGWIDEVIAALPHTSDADFAGMWRTAPVKAGTIAVPHDCCSEWGRKMSEAAAERAARVAANGSAGMNGQGTPGMHLVPTGGDYGAEMRVVHDLLAKVRTGAYLNAATFDPLHFHVDGLVPEGLTVLAGAPKIGKSWMVLGWLLKLAGTGAAVLYLALEDSDRRMQWRCRKLLGQAPVPATFWYLTEEGVVPGMLLPTVAEFVKRNAGRKPLIVVDTLAKACQQTPRIKDEPAYERDYRVTSALQAAVKGCPGAGLVICHHDRKSGGEDWLDKISGTKGITGGPDAVMLLERKRSEEAGTLRVSGRDIAEEDYAMTFAGGCRWEYDGGTLPAAAAAYLTRQAQHGLADRSAQIVALAHERGAKGIRRDDAVAAIDGITPNAASEYLARLWGSGRLRKVALGLYACVCCVCSPPPQPPAGGPAEHTQHTPPHVGPPPGAPAAGNPDPPGGGGPVLPPGMAVPAGAPPGTAELMALVIAGTVPPAGNGDVPGTGPTAAAPGNRYGGPGAWNGPCTRCGATRGVPSLPPPALCWDCRGGPA